jgi:hypothetical protein
MKKLLKICDLYGTHFHLFYNYKPKYHTCYGGLLSIISVLSSIFVFILFIINDLNKNTSISNTSFIPPTIYKNIKSGEEKLYLPWRIIDYNEKMVDYKGKIFPKIYYFFNKYSNETSSMDSHYYLINYKPCNETNMKNIQDEILLDIPIEKLYCIDMEDLYIGGSWIADSVNYVRFDLYLCEDGIDYNATNEKCTSREYLINEIGNNNSWILEFFYPVIQFQPTVRNLPILVYYKTYFYTISLNSNKLDRIFFQQHILEDQQNLIFNNPVNKSYWGISSLTGDNYFNDNRDPVRYGSTSRLYSLKIYLDYSTIFYTRKYKKIIEILGEAFPFINFISSTLRFISTMISELKAHKKLNKYIVHNHKELLKRKKNNNKEINTSVNKIKNMNNLDYIQKGGQEINITNKSKIFGDSSKLSCFNSNTNNNLLLNTKNEYAIKKLFQEKKKYKIFNTVNFSKFNVKNFENFKKNKKFPLIYYFYGFCINKIYPRKNNNYTCISAKFHKMFKFYTRLLDITSYISIYKTFEELKKTILNEINEREIINYKKEKVFNKNNDINSKRNIISRIILRANNSNSDNYSSFY